VGGSRRRAGTAAACRDPLSSTTHISKLTAYTPQLLLGRRRTRPRSARAISRAARAQPLPPPRLPLPPSRPRTAPAACRAS
jgi:hypothetical protein